MCCETTHLLYYIKAFGRGERLRHTTYHRRREKEREKESFFEKKKKDDKKVERASS